MQRNILEVNPMLVAEFMPSPLLRETDHVAVAAPPERAWTLAREFDVARIPFVRALFELRILPERIAAFARRKQQPAAASVGIEAIERRRGPGFAILGEEAGREVVAGAVGRFWKPHIEWASVTPAQFRDFAEPGWGKVAWSVRVDPREAGGSWITFEVRVGATDARSFQRFRPYWAAIGRFSRAIRRAGLRRMRGELGAPGAADVAGDPLLSSVRYQRTDERFIDAPPAQVWPWLVQMGCRRAGWYSWDRLDNGGKRSADRIVPELQTIAEGDIIPATPSDKGGFAVLRVQRERALVLGSPRLLPGGAAPGTEWPPYDATWAFQLEPVGVHATHLTVRVRRAYEPGLRNSLLRVGIGAVHRIMQGEQLRNLKKRAEAGAR
jgi:hypothetical protein